MNDEPLEQPEDLSGTALFYARNLSSRQEAFPALFASVNFDDVLDYLGLDDETPDLEKNRQFPRVGYAGSLKITKWAYEILVPFWTYAHELGSNDLKELKDGELRVVDCGEVAEELVGQRLESRVETYFRRYSGRINILFNAHLDDANLRKYDPTHLKIRLETMAETLGGQVVVEDYESVEETEELMRAFVHKSPLANEMSNLIGTIKTRDEGRGEIIRLTIQKMCYLHEGRQREAEDLETMIKRLVGRTS